MNKILLNILSFYIFLTGLLGVAQTPTIGLRYQDVLVSDGYVLFTPDTNTSVYLINNCGEKVNEWNFTERPGATCYLLDNGNLLRTGKSNIEIRDWEDNVLWSYAMSNLGLNQHHDIEPLPNGNVLCLITDTYTDAQMIAFGKDPATLADTVKLEKIIELEPVGTNDANVVWEWKFIDHVIQDFDDTKPNYGVVANHPELIDLNYYDLVHHASNNDYTHANAIDYNPILNQILISFRNLNEIYSIDHSTSTVEASGHQGGNSNLGGDILWRWGNPEVYRQGNSGDKKLRGQHDPKWVEQGYFDQGKISVLNNEGDGSAVFSSIHLISPEINGTLYQKESNKFIPLDYDWSWNGIISQEQAYKTKKSGTHALPNGNMIIAESSKGQVSEIARNGDVLWTYKNPSGTDGIIFNQFDTETAGNGFFRAEKYPADFIGFTGEDLSPQTIIENENSLSVACRNALSVNEIIASEFNIKNPITNNTLVFNKTINVQSIRIIDLSGKVISQFDNYRGNTLKVNLKSSFYIL